MLSQTVEYALRAVTCLAQNADRPLSAKQLSELTKVPHGYLSKVLQPLARGGLLRSQRGLHGGFMLAMPPDTVTILRVVNMVDPINRITTCPLNIKSHGKSLCPLHRKLDDVAALIERAFGGVTIADMLKPSNHSTPLCDLTIGRSA